MFANPSPHPSPKGRVHLEDGDLALTTDKFLAHGIRPMRVEHTFLVMELFIGFALLNERIKRSDYFFTTVIFSSDGYCFEWCTELCATTPFDSL